MFSRAEMRLPTLLRDRTRFSRIAARASSVRSGRHLPRACRLPAVTAFFVRIPFFAPPYVALAAFVPAGLPFSGLTRTGRSAVRPPIAAACVRRSRIESGSRHAVHDRRRSISLAALAGISFRSTLAGELLRRFRRMVLRTGLRVRRCAGRFPGGRNVRRARRLSEESQRSSPIFVPQPALASVAAVIWVRRIARESH